MCRRMLRMCEEAASQGRNVEKILQEIQKEQGIVYAAQQRLAVETAAQSGVFLLTGGPGTGKTTCVRGIVAMLERMGYAVELAAPTGRAAKRLGDACAREAQTIHRMLGMSYSEELGEVTFAKNEKEPLNADAVIIDEMSMVDCEPDALIIGRPAPRLPAGDGGRRRSAALWGPAMYFQI